MLSGAFLREATSHKGELAHLYGDCRDPSKRSGDGWGSKFMGKHLDFIDVKC